MGKYQSSKQTPDIRPMQFESSSGGIFKDSVNLFRGDVNLNIDLVSLTGRNNLDVKLTAFYGSNVKGTICDSNVKAPADILGLGWELPFERIEVQERDNSTANDDIYLLYSNNTATELVRSNKSWCRAVLDAAFSAALNQGKVNAAIVEAFAEVGLLLAPNALVEVKLMDTEWVISDSIYERQFHVIKQAAELKVQAGGTAFECYNYDFSQIRYYPEFERWEIVKDDGTVSCYGGSDNASNGQNAIQWKVFWKNWTGETGLVTADGSKLQTRRPFAWNLVSVENIWADKLRFYYQTVEQQVGIGGLNFTKACYLSRITDMLSRSIELNYEEKDYIPDKPEGPREYMAPHWNSPYTMAPDNNPSPYQDRYKTRYLDNICVRNKYGDILYTVQLDYNKTSNFSSYSSQDYKYGDTVKRTLTGIRRIFSNNCAKPGLEFKYWQAGDVNAGALSTVIQPEGARIEYRYKRQELSLCDRQLQIVNPWPKAAKPRVWFGPDYAIVTWYNDSTSQLSLSIYTWLGRWQEWSPAASTIKVPLDISSMNAVTNENFVCLYFTSVSLQKSYVLSFHKNNLVWGAWLEETMLTFSSTELAVASGDNFYLACDQENRILYCYTWDYFGRSWAKADVSGNLPLGNAKAKPYIAAANKYYAILDYSTASSSEHKNKLALFYQENNEWNVGGIKDLSFTIGGYKPENSFGFSAGASFIALTFITSEEALQFHYTVRILSWDVSYQNLAYQDFLYRLPKSNPSKVITIPFIARIVYNCMVVSGPYVLRYNGVGWLENTSLNFRDTCTDSDIFWYAYGKDYAICTSNRDYACEAKLLAYNPCKNTNEWNNTPVLLYKKDSSTGNRKTHFFPTAGENIATMDNRVYSRGSQCSWADAASSYQEISGEINSTTMINEGPQFLAYLNLKGDTATTASLQPLTNQSLSNAEVINQWFYTQISTNGMIKTGINGQYPAGPASFLTYLPVGKDFDYAESITLYRFLEDSLNGTVVDYCVDTMTCFDGYQYNTTKYLFDISTAVCDPSGSVVKYYRSLCYPGTSSEDNPKFGYIENTYYNSLTQEQTKAALLGSRVNAELAAASGILDGQLISRKTYNSTGKLLIEETNQYSTYTGITRNGCNYPLYGGYFRCTQNRLLEDGIDKATAYHYDDGYGKLIKENFDNVDQNGALQNYIKTYSYAYEAYPWFIYRHAIDVYLSQYDLLAASDSKEEVLRGSLQTYGPFSSQVSEPTAQSFAVWSTTNSYVLKEAPADELKLDKLTGEEPGAEWLLVNGVEQRTNHGMISRQKDAFGKVETIQYDKDEVLTVANFKNAGDNECTYVGFEKYENYTQDWTTGIQSVESCIVTGDAHTGNQSFRLLPQETLKKSNSLNQSQTLVLSAWVKAEKGFLADSGSAYFILTDTEGNIEKYEIKPDMEGKWTYCQVVAYYDKEIKRTFTLSVENTKASKYLLLNDVCAAPLVGEAKVKVYDTIYEDVIAEIGVNADIIRYAYDSFRNKCIQIDPWESVKKGTMCYYNKQWANNGEYTFPQTDPNREYNVVAESGGLYETFTKGDQIWEEWSTKSPGSWKVKCGKLIHTGTAKDSISWLLTKDSVSYAAGICVTANDSSNVSFRINIGDQLSVAWSQNSGWSMQLAGKSYTESNHNPAIPVNILLLPIAGAVYLLSDGRQVFAQSTELQFSGMMSLEAMGELEFTNPVIYIEPQASIDYKDGAGKVIQTQVECEKQCYAKQKLYNELSLEVINTKIVKYTDTLFGYRPELVSSIDWQTGILSGEVSSYYPEDEGYPYYRNEYEDSSLGRLVKKGLPGKKFAITPDNLHVYSIRYGVDSQASVAGIRYVKGSYLVNQITDTQGNVIYELKDRLGRTLGKQSDCSGKMEAVQQVYDTAGNLIRILHPNYFQGEPDSGSYFTSQTYNFLGQMIMQQTTDTAETRYIYDKAGQLRFSMNSLSQEQGCILYKKYDILGRITEEGWFTGEWGDGSVWQELADTDSNYPGNGCWSKRNEYDGNGEDYTLRGRLYRIYNNKNSDGKAEVINSYGYNSYGYAVLSELNAEGQQDKSISYHYDNLGHVIEVDYPDSVLYPRVIYGYNSLGQNISVGIPESPCKFAAYSYNADGSLCTEQLNSAGSRPVKRTFSYNSPGWITMINNEYNDETPILKLNYSYTEGGYQGAAYYNGNIARMSTINGIVSGKSFDYSFRYDGQGQLETAQHSMNPAYSLGVDSPVVFDPNGNVINSCTGNTQTTYLYKEGSNQILSIQENGNTLQSYAYDIQGNIKYSSQRGISNIRYNLITNLPEEVEFLNGTDRISYQYNGIGQRVIKTKPDGKTKLYVHGMNDMPLMEADQEVTQYIYGIGGLVTAAKNGDTYYVLKDHQGSVRAMLDEGGSIQAMMDYLPYGGVIPDSYGNTGLLCYRFTGQEYEEELDLYNYRARFYDTTIGRFYSTDPQSMYGSPYSYCGNDPFNLTDPTGEIATLLIILLTGAAIGAALGAAGAAYTGYKSGLRGGALAGYIFAGAGIGAVAGALSALGGVGAFAAGSAAAAATTSATAGIVAGIAAGTATGAAAGAVIGAAQGVSQHFINDAFGVPNAGSWQHSMMAGAITGAVSGAITGAMAGGCGAFASLQNSIHPGLGYNYKSITQVSEAYYTFQNMQVVPLPSILTRIPVTKVVSAVTWVSAKFTLPTMASVVGGGAKLLTGLLIPSPKQTQYEQPPVQNNQLETDFFGQKSYNPSMTGSIGLQRALLFNPVYWKTAE